MTVSVEEYPLILKLFRHLILVLQSHFVHFRFLNKSFKVKVNQSAHSGDRSKSIQANYSRPFHETVFFNANGEFVLLN